MCTKYIIALSTLLLSSAFAGGAQTVEDIGKIVIGVKVLPSSTEETKANSTYLHNKLINVATEAGFSSYGENSLIMTPSITINDIQIVEGGLKNIYVVNGELFVSIQEGDSGTVYASTFFQFKGSGTSKESAIKAGMNKISYGNLNQLFMISISLCKVATEAVLIISILTKLLRISTLHNNTSG